MGVREEEQSADYADYADSFRIVFDTRVISGAGRNGFVATAAMPRLVARQFRRIETPG
jgi:hypothetical protein